MNEEQKGELLKELLERFGFYVLGLEKNTLLRFTNDILDNWLSLNKHKIEPLIDESKLIELNKEYLNALKWFCERVEKGEIRSKRTYVRFKSLIEESTELPEKEIIIYQVFVDEQKIIRAVLPKFPDRMMFEYPPFLAHTSFNLYMEMLRQKGSPIHQGLYPVNPPIRIIVRNEGDEQYAVFKGIISDKP